LTPRPSDPGGRDRSKCPRRGSGCPSPPGLSAARCEV
jgi:hypothetical protein